MNFCILNAKISPHIIAVHVASRRSLCGVETKCEENYCRVSILLFSHAICNFISETKPHRSNMQSYFYTQKKCPQINFRLIFSIILWIKKLFEILPTLTITVFKKIDHCIKLFRKKQLKCDNLTTLYRDMYFIECNTFSSE